MGPIGERLASHTVLGVDTPIFVYHFEAHPRYLPLTEEILRGVQNGRWAAITSVLTLMELTVRPWQLNRAAVARAYEALLIHYPNLSVADVTLSVARQAAQLRARYRLRPADALQVATALTLGATVFVSNGRAFMRLLPLLDIIILDDFAAP